MVLRAGVVTGRPTNAAQVGIMSAWISLGGEHRATVTTTVRKRGTVAKIIIPSVKCQVSYSFGWGRMVASCDAPWVCNVIVCQKITF